ncbi:hypothetical protein ACEQPO_22695 [Bacillus sp. SL00103]
MTKKHAEEAVMTTHSSLKTHVFAYPIEMIDNIVSQVSQDTHLPLSS